MPFVRGTRYPLTRPSPWTPARLPLRFWYDFSAEATVYQDAARTTPAKGTDPIGGVADLSGNSRHLGQSTAGTRPAVDVAGINGRRAVKFASGTKWLSTGSFSNLPQPCTVYVVVRNANRAGTQTVYDGESTGGRTACFINSSQWTGYAGGFSGELLFADAGVYILGFEYNGASSHIYRNGVETRGGSAATTVLNMGTQGMGGFTLGSDSAKTNFPFTGWVGEVVAIDGLVSAANRARLELYLSKKWARPVYQRPVFGTLNGDLWVLLVPPTYTAGTPKLIVYFHGHGTAGGAVYSDPITWSSVQSLQTAGYWIAACDGSGDHWGRPASAAANVALLQYLTQRQLFSKILYWPISMGGAACFATLANGGFPAPDGCYLTYPVCNLANMYNNGSGQYAVDIRAAYGVASDGSDFAAKTAGSDPVLRAASAYPAIPYRFVASYGDLVVDQVNNTDAMMTLLGSRSPAPPVLTLREHTGNHGDATAFNAADQIAFFDAC